MALALPFPPSVTPAKAGVQNVGSALLIDNKIMGKADLSGGSAGLQPCHSTLPQQDINARPNTPNFSLTPP